MWEIFFRSDAIHEITCFSEDDALILLKILFYCWLKTAMGRQHERTKLQK